MYMYMYIMYIFTYDIVLQLTPLMLATINGKPEVARVLLRHGSSVTDRMEVLGENLNCLEAAVEKGKRYTTHCIILAHGVVVLRHYCSASVASEHIGIGMMRGLGEGASCVISY